MEQAGLGLWVLVFVAMVLGLRVLILALATPLGLVSRCSRCHRAIWRVKVPERWRFFESWKYSAGAVPMDIEAVLQYAKLCGECVTADDLRDY